MPHFFLLFDNPSNKTSVKGVELQARNSVIHSLSAHSAQPSLTDSILDIDGATYAYNLTGASKAECGVQADALEPEKLQPLSVAKWPSADHSMEQMCSNITIYQRLCIRYLSNIDQGL